VTELFKKGLSKYYSDDDDDDDDDGDGLIVVVVVTGQLVDGVVCVPTLCVHLHNSKWKYDDGSSGSSRVLDGWDGAE
jgi:hypothetical protein